jgi:hypothetical protein
MSSAQVTRRFSVLITEILADPTPAVRLPQTEFIELTNVSIIPFNLKDWTISDRTSTATISANYLLQPDSTVILCTNAASAAYSGLGRTIGISNFPSLDNDADLIVLHSKEGYIIHAVDYNNAWYQNDLKNAGGWSLEMIDIRNPCSGATNWRASTDPSGGTPGKRNSVNKNNPDDIAPALWRTYSTDSFTVIAVFNESLDSVSAANTSNFDLENIQPLVAIPVAPLFSEVLLKFANKLSGNIIYNLKVKNVHDCAGNTVGSRNETKAGLTAIPGTGDIAINEILFNPKLDGFDFIELYNKSKKIVDIKNLFVANRNVTGGLTNINQLSTTSFFLFPEEYLVLTEHPIWLNQNYTVRNMERLKELSSFPSLPDDKGHIVIADQTGKSIEELQYDSKWHFALIDNDEGISLERIDYSQPVQNKNNWTSAASTAGFATPGYQNSQFKADQQLQGMISTVPKIFSPDNDGMDDFAIIQYQMTAPGYVANVTIFDASGRIVRYLERNTTLTLQGSFRWNGLDDKLQQLPVGVYIVFTEVFNLQGRTRRFKNAITLARRF